MRANRRWEAEYERDDGERVLISVVAQGVIEARELADERSGGMTFIGLHMGGRVAENYAHSEEFGDAVRDDRITGDRP